MPSEQKRDSIQECRPLPLLQALCSLPRPIMGVPPPPAAVFVAQKECFSLSPEHPFPLILLSLAFLLTSACWESN